MNEQAQLSVQQQLDQFGATMRDFAPQVVGYHRSLLEHGMAKRAALELTLQFQELWLVKVLGLAGGER